MKVYAQVGFVVLLLALMVIVPVAADVTTSVLVVEGTGGSAPVILAKWETEPDSPYLESADQSHSTQGSQFMPPGTFEGKKLLNYYVIVTDAENNGNVKKVAADVYHPDGTFKYQVDNFVQLEKADGIKAFMEVEDIGLITTACDCPGSIEVKSVIPGCPDLLNELNKGTSSVWVGSEFIDYHQMDGNYLVKAYAFDQTNRKSQFLNNLFYYQPVTAVEYDFSRVDYGSVEMGSPVWRSGDVFFANDDGKPTVRNIGNTKAQFIINQNDMNFGQSSQGNWNVLFDARLGHTSPELYYSPNTDHTLVDVLDRCNTDELDFSIHVIKPTTKPTEGSMTLRVQNPDQYSGPMTYCQWND